jgi:hypothetical protein
MKPLEEKNLYLSYSIMGKDINTSIRDNYDFYQDLLSNRKSIFKEVIEISEFGNNKNTLQKKEPLTHVTLPNEIIFIVTVEVTNHKSFKFKIRCNDCCPEPFFRYDSDGITHRNNFDNIPLSEQQITTPHFHRFNEEGITFAYKSASLLKEEERKALEDINLCIAHFFNEGNIRLNDDEVCTVSINPQELPLVHENLEDPLSKLSFI